MRFTSNYTFRLCLTRSSCKKNVMPTSIIPCHNMVSDASSHSILQTISGKYLAEAAFLWISKKLISRMTQERHSLCKCYSAVLWFLFFHAHSVHQSHDSEPHNIQSKSGLLDSTHSECMPSFIAQLCLVNYLYLAQTRKAQAYMQQSVWFYNH